MNWTYILYIICRPVHGVSSPYASGNSGKLEESGLLGCIGQAIIYIMISNLIQLIRACGMNWTYILYRICRPVHGVSSLNASGNSGKLEETGLLYCIRQAIIYIIISNRIQHIRACGLAWPILERSGRFDPSSKRAFSMERTLKIWASPLFFGREPHPSDYLAHLGLELAEVFGLPC